MRGLRPWACWIAATLALCSAEPVAAQPAGDSERGAALFRQCVSCHSVEPGGSRKRGPSLNEIFGRKAAAQEDFEYSKAMQRAGADGLVWSHETLDAFIENPKALVSRSSMQFRGVPDAQERADLIAFLRGYSAQPSNIPESAPSAPPTDHDLDPAILALQGDPEYGEYLSSECVTCHRADGVDRGIPAITGWPRDDFVIAMHAYKSKTRQHPVMQMVAGRLSNEEIAGLAAYFEAIGDQ